MSNSSTAGSSMSSVNNNDPTLLAKIHTLPKEVRNLVAGGLAGMIAKSFVAPIDRIKILYQVTSAQFHLRDVPRVAYSIIEKEGWAALWKGNTATMIRVFPYSGIQFMIFDYCKVTILGQKDKQKKQMIQPLQSQPQQQQQRNTYDDVKGGPTLANISHRGTIAIPSASNNDIKNNKQKEMKKGGLSPVESLVSGMIAGTISVVCTYPLDMARAQLAVLRKKKKPKPVDGVSISKLDGQLGIGSTKSSSKKGLGYVLSSSFEHGGIRGLYRGITPTILGILPYSGVAFTINEQAKRQISHIMQREPTTIERLQCGALSGLFAQTLAYPLEVTRRRMQTIGIVPTSGTESAAVNFAGVSQLKHQVDELPETAVDTQSQTTKQPQQSTTASTPRPNVAAASESAIGQSISSSKAIASKSSQHQQLYHKPPSMITTMQHLFEEQGMRGFYKGVSMNWVKGPIAFSISFTAFDTIQGWIETDVERERKHQLNTVVKNSIQRRLTDNDESH